MLKYLFLLPSWLHEIISRITGYVLVRTYDDTTNKTIKWDWQKSKKFEKGKE